jgi:hypothetical protein
MKTVSLCWTLAIALFVQPLMAESVLDFDEPGKAPTSTSEYVFRSTVKPNLIPVQVLGSVAKPGLYYVPPNTNLVKLLTLAGGPQNTADAEEIVVKKADASWEHVKAGGLTRDHQAYKVDFEPMLKRGDQSRLPMSPNDIVYVPAKQPWFSNNLTRSVTIVSLVMGIVLTGILIDEHSRK